MTNKAIESPSTSVSKDAPVSKKFNSFDTIYKIVEELDTDEITEFYDSWFEKAKFKPDMSSEEKESSRFVRKTTAYVLGLLSARKGDDRYRKYANSLKNEDDEVIRAVSEFAQGLRNAVEASMESTPYTSTKKECKKLLNWLDNYNDTVLKPAYEMLPPDGSNRSASGTSLESIAERVMDDYFAEVDPLFAYIPKYYVSQLLEVSGMTNLKEKDGTVNGNTLKSRRNKLYDELYRERDEDTIGYVLDVMDRIGEAVEDFGVNATDARSKWQYENFKNQLDIINDRFIRDRRRNRFFRPSAEQPGQSEQSPSEQYIMVPPSSGDALAIGPDEHAGGVEFLDEEQPPVEQPPEQPPIEQPEQPPDDGNPLNGFKLYNTIRDEVLRPWRDAEYGKEYMNSIGPGYHTMPKNLYMLEQTALRVYLASLGHISKEEANRAREELVGYLNEAIELDPGELRVTFDVLDSIAEALEKAGANATDAKSRLAYERSKKRLDITKTLMEPLREKVYSEQPPIEQPPIEQPPIEQPEQPPEQPPASAKAALKKSLENALNETMRPWKEIKKNAEASEDRKNTAKKVISYTRKAWDAAKRPEEGTPEADEAQRTIDELSHETDGDAIKGVYDALSRAYEAAEELGADATDEASVDLCNRFMEQLSRAKDEIVYPAYDRYFHKESPGERADRLYSIAIERLNIPKERLDDILSNVHEFGWDLIFDLIDAVNDVYSAKIWEMQGNSPEKDREERNNTVDEIKALKRKGFRKAEKVMDELYFDIDWSISNDIFGSMNKLYNTIRTSKDNGVRVVARSFYDVLTDMQHQSKYHQSEARYNEYLDGLPKTPEGEMPKDLENLNDDLEYLRSKDDTRRILDRFIPANARDPLRFLVEHYMPPLNDSAAFENWKNSEPILRELAEQLPWGGVDTEHTVNMLASLLQDAQRYYGDTHRATPYGVYLSKLAEAPERTQELMENNGFLFEKREYIKRLREAYSLEGEYRDRELDRILNDMSEDITSIRNLGASANDPLSRNLKGDMEFFRDGADKFKNDLEQLRDAVTRAMNGEAVEPPGWTGFVDWADMLNPNNSLDGLRAYMNLAERDKEADVERHYRKRRKFYPQFEVRDMWNNPRGDPQSIMKRLRNRGIIPGAQPGYSTRQGYTAQPIIGPKDFEELSAMVGPYYYNRTRLDANQPGLYEFSQKALRIASNLAFDMRNEADAKAVRQFEQALEIAGRCRKGAASGGQPGPRRTTERGETNRVGSGHLNYQETRDMFRGALRDI